jgi:phytoene dehydrogenase-like protein
MIIGGGLGGLLASIEAAEAGMAVTLHEAHQTLGGRARTSPSPHIAHEGPHVIYSDGPTWAWLRRRQLLGRTAAVPAAAMGGFVFRRAGQLSRWPGRGLVQALLTRRQAPVDLSFVEWATALWGAESAAVAASASGVTTYHHDPGSLSARFVHERLRRAFSPPPKARYVVGGWSVLIARLAEVARSLGVRVETGHRVTDLPTDRPLIVATSLAAARVLLRDETLEQESGATALVDVAVRQDRRDAFVVSDLDHCGWLERFSAPDPGLAPHGESLIQAQVPIRPGDSTAEAIARVDALLALGVPGFADRTTWRRESLARARTGAVDLPGRTWRDRPAIDRGNQVFLVGDQVAAPGLLSEVTVNSALRAAALAAGTSPVAGRPSTTRPGSGIRADR